MSRPTIPDDLKRFTLTSIPSIPYLEALLLMRADTTQAWHAANLGNRLYMQEKVAASLLTQLDQAGVLAVVNADLKSYRYQPASEQYREMIDRLAAMYALHLVEITNLIHSTIDKRAYAFADAFIWRKDT